MTLKITDSQYGRLS